MITTLSEKRQQLHCILKEYEAVCRDAISYKVLLEWERCYPEFAVHLAALHCRLCIEKLRRMRCEDEKGIAELATPIV